MKVVMIAAIICWTLFVSINSSAVISPEAAAKIRSNGRLEASNRCEKKSALEIGAIIAIGTLITTLWSIIPTDQAVTIEISTAIALSEPVWYMNKGNAYLFPPPKVEDEAPASIRFDAKSRKWQGSEGALAYKIGGGPYSLVIGWNIPVIAKNKFGAQVVQAQFASEEQIKAKYDGNTIPWQTVGDFQEWFVADAVNGMIVEGAMGNRAQASLRVNLVQQI